MKTKFKKLALITSLLSLTVTGVTSCSRDTSNSIVTSSNSSSQTGSSSYSSSEKTTTSSSSSLSSSSEETSTSSTSTVNEALERAKSQAISELNSYKNPDDYRDEEQSKITSILAEATTAINACTSEEEIASIVSSTKTKLDALKTKAQYEQEEAKALSDAKDAKKAEIDTLANKYSKDNYRDAEQALIDQYVAEAKADVDALTTIDAVNAYTTDALKTKLDALKTKAQYEQEEAKALSDAKDAKKAEIDTLASKYDKSNYRSEQQEEIDEAIAAAKATVDGYDNITDVNAYTTDDLKTKLDSIKTNEELTKEEKLQEALTDKLKAIDDLADSYPDSNYRTDEVNKKNEAVKKAKDEVNALTTEEAITNYSLDDLDDTLKSLKTDAQYKEDEEKALSEAKATKIADIDTLGNTYDKSKYRSEQQKEIDAAIAAAKETVNGYTSLDDINSYTTDDLKKILDAIMTEEEWISYNLEYKLNDEGTEYSVVGIGKATTATSIVIPSTHEGLPVVSVADKAFINKSTYLTSVTIADSVTSIGSSAFEGCDKLQTVILSNNITSIGSSAFKYCINLTSINLPSGLSVIESYTFQNCIALTSVTIPERVTTLKACAFYKCTALVDVTLPSTLTNIDASCFYNDSKLTTVYSRCESYDAWDTITISSANNSPLIDANLYIYASSKPSEVDRCWHYVDDVPTSWFTDDEMEALKLKYSLNNDKASYTVSGKGSISKTDLVIPSTYRGKPVTSIGRVFEYYTSIKSISLPNTLTSIQEQAFYQCKYLTEITLPTSLESLGDNVFSHSGLETISVPGNVKTIGNSCFSNSSLKSAVLEEGVTTITKSIFDICSSLEYVILPTTLNTAPAFYNCSSLSKVFFKGTADDWSKISGTYNNSATVYYYSESQPTDSGNYWHYVNDVATPW